MGHSGYAPPGQDIVCAAISVLTDTLVTALADEGCAADLQLAAGYADVRIDNLSRRGKHFIEFFARGAQRVEEAYPNYVHVDEKGGIETNGI